MYKAALAVTDWHPLQAPHPGQPGSAGCNQVPNGLVCQTVSTSPAEAWLGPGRDTVHAVLSTNSTQTTHVDAREITVTVTYWITWPLDTSIVHRQHLGIRSVPQLLVASRCIATAAAATACCSNLPRRTPHSHPQSTPIYCCCCCCCSCRHRMQRCSDTPPRMSPFAPPFFAQELLLLPLLPWRWPLHAAVTLPSCMHPSATRFRDPATAVAATAAAAAAAADVAAATACCSKPAATHAPTCSSAPRPKHCC